VIKGLFQPFVIFVYFCEIIFEQEETEELRAQLAISFHIILFIREIRG
jgi:hypothetical protein